MTIEAVVCSVCQQTIAKTEQPPGTEPLMQAVFTMKDGKPQHVPPCPPRNEE